MKPITRNLFGNLGILKGPRYLVSTLVALLPFLSVGAQDYPRTDENGNVIYYKIFSADPLYEGMCLQDDSRTSTQYHFGLANHTADNTYQEWMLVPGNTEGTYQLRNRATWRYIATSGSWQEAFFSINYSAKASSNNEILFTPLGDADKGPEIFEKKNHKNTSRAWIIYPSNSIPNDITTAESSQISIQAIDRHIVVTDTSHYDIYDIQGRRVDSESELLPGVYVVEAAGTVKNVLIK